MARPMLLVVGVRWPPETFIERRLEGLVAAGYEVVVATNGSRAVTRTPAGLRLELLPPADVPFAARLLRLGAAIAKAAIRSLPETIRFARAARHSSRSVTETAEWLYRLLPFVGLKPDLLHFEWNFAAVLHLPLFDLIGCPVTVSCRGAHVQVAPHNPERRRQVEKLPLTFAKAAAIHCVSEAIRGELRHFGVSDLSKTRIIRPAVDHRFFTPGPGVVAVVDKLRIVTTGSLGWRKGLEYALLALRRLVDRGVDASLEIIGDGPKSDRQRVLYTIQDLEIESRVRLHGKLDPKGVREVLHSSEAFLLSSLSEGISNAVLEAMACGLPVVTTDCGGMNEAVTDGVEGFVTPVRDPDAQAAALGMLAQDPGLRRGMGCAARARVEKDFTLAAQIVAWTALYGSLLEEHPSPKTRDAPATAAGAPR